jgi:DNA-binding winged helix-turn-helix (wHTH) protein
MATAWPKLFVHESNLKVNIANLRRSLCDTQRQPIYIATVIGRGYQFVASVEIGASAGTDKNAEPDRAALLPLPPAWDRRLPQSNETTLAGSRGARYLQGESPCTTNP